MGDKTLVVNLWAGPGTGKSTNAALVFGKLKVAGIETELVHEYAKDLTWEGRTTVLGRQSYVMAKQQHHIERVLGQVEVIVTDSPLPFGIIYKGNDYSTHLEKHIIQVWRRWWNLNIFLRRNTSHHPYVEGGRSQTLEEAQALDVRIGELMERLDPHDHIVHEIQEGEKTADNIVFDVLCAIGKSPHGR